MFEEQKLEGSIIHTQFVQMADCTSVVIRVEPGTGLESRPWLKDAQGPEPDFPWDWNVLNIHA